MTTTRRPTLTVALAATMAFATFCLIVFGVLAAELIEEFSVQRWQIGALVTATSLAGALVSPWLGVVTDRSGGRRMMLATLLSSAIALAFVALAPGYVLLVLAAVVTGLAQGASNPATNKVIASHIPLGQRGVVTGIKQSGVQFGTFFGGLLLPVGALAWGWRWAVLAAAAIALVAFGFGVLTVPPDPPRQSGPGEAEAGGGDLPPLIRRLAIYGFLLGAGGSAVFTYLPLFTREDLGLGPEAAGITVAVTGSVGVVARIGWGRIAETVLGSSRSLRWIALLAVVGAAGLMLADRTGSWWVWPAAALVGLSASAWNTVGMLAVIESVPVADAGRASGVVLLGFLLGLAAGAPALGWSVDVLGTYLPGWIAVAVLFAAGWVTVRPAQGG